MGKSVLVVDDHLSFCHHIQAILRSSGYEVEVTTSPLEALDKLRQQPYDVLLTDMRLPHFDGITLFQEAKKVDSGISGVIMTAYGTIESAVEAMRKGAFDYITKPFRKEQILMTIAKALKKRQELTGTA